MQFFIEAECQNCGPLTPVIVRLSMNAGIYRLCAITCPQCGAHMQVWMTKEEFQELFLKRMRENKHEDSTP